MAIDLDALSGRLFPANASQWAEASAKLASPGGVVGCQNAGSPLTNAIGAPNMAFEALEGTGALYQQTKAGFTRKAVKWNGAGGRCSFSTGSGGFAGPQTNDNGAGTGAIAAFGVFSMSAPANCLGYNAFEFNNIFGNQVQLIVGRGDAGSQIARLIFGSSTTPSIDLPLAGNYLDGVPHAFFLQARETAASTIELTLDTDLESVSTTGSFSFSSLTDQQFILYCHEGNLTTDQLYFAWWRGAAALTAGERVALMETLLWREPPPPETIPLLPRELYDPVSGSIGLHGRDVRPAREVGNG